jgi:tRNA (guanine10-N2)-dimethyltransferase
VYVLELAGQDDTFAAYEARQAAAGVTVIAPGLAIARGITDRVRRLAFTHRTSELVGRAAPTVAAARTLLEAAPIDREGSVAVRAIDVRATAGIDTQEAERELGQVLVDRGFAVDLDDPDHELRALFAAGGSDSRGDGEATADGGTCALGWLTTESVRGFTSRQPTDRPFFQPGSMDPMLARALAHVAGARPGAIVLDPMCGTGGILIEAGLVGARVLGLDVQRKMVRGARKNLATSLDGHWSVLRGDAATLPIDRDGVDGVVFDAPYGRQSKIEGDLDELVGDALAEARRVAGRCVVVGDRSWADRARDAGWTVDATFQRRVHRSLTRHVVVLDQG